MDPLIFHADLPAPIDDVWAAWTTEDGLTSFLAPACRVSCVPDGPYEIYFDPDAPEGRRGSEGMRVLAVEAPRFLSFTWNGPPSLPRIRAQRTWVEIRLESQREGCRLTLVNGGYGEGPDWIEAHRYFRRAWGNVVIPRLRRYLDHGPVDWTAS